MIELNENTIKRIIKYFEENKNKEKIINSHNLTFALRRFISRYISNCRQDNSIKNDSALRSWIVKDDIWSQIVVGTEMFELEIENLFPYIEDISIGQCYNFYMLLNGDEILKEYLDEKIYGKSDIK